MGSINSIFGAINKLADELYKSTGIRTKIIKVSPRLSSILGCPVSIHGINVEIETFTSGDYITFVIFRGDEDSNGG